MSIDRKVKEPSTYLENICSVNGYSDIITVEHRSNNPKRDFLFVNKKQCKHIPCSPSEMLNMCYDLTKIVSEGICNKHGRYNNILVVGFAETATAIGHAVARMLPQCKYVMTTTREDIAGSRELITFEEEHSHATTQKLLFWNNLDDSIIEECNYILFVEDEISTGNTILNFIKTFENKFGKNKFKFGVASVCNWQNNENRAKFESLDIDTFALIRGDLKSADIKMGVSDKDLLPEDTIIQDLFSYKKNNAVLTRGSSGDDFQRNRLGHLTFGSNSNEYKHYTDFVGGGKSIRVIGTEECMYPAIEIGKHFEELGFNVICHANTRSKIDILDSDFDDGASGIKSRVKLHSAYDTERETYLYNVNIHTDKVIVVTDSTNEEAIDIFMHDITNLFGCRTDFIKIIRL